MAVKVNEKIKGSGKFWICTEGITKGKGKRSSLGARRLLSR